jgi:hypothetical protein
MPQAPRFLALWVVRGAGWGLRRGISSIISLLTMVIVLSRAISIIPT